MPDGVVKSFDSSTVPIEVSVQGEVETEAVEYARKRIRTVMDHIGEPVIFVRVRLTVAPDPARDRPALAHATLDVDGELVRAHVAAHEPREAADLLQRRLLDQLEHRASHRRALRRRSSRPEPGEWRHGDQPPDRPD